ncbi:MAG TPA: hypothetical protein VK963_02560 [Candidatus Saccharimonadales bacterium]|nr:hypothetical protein [Candidatus Saccharimonadales bacterium]
MTEDQLWSLSGPIWAVSFTVGVLVGLTWIGAFIAMAAAGLAVVTLLPRIGNEVSDFVLVSALALGAGALAIAVVRLMIVLLHLLIQLFP